MGSCVRERTNDQSASHPNLSVFEDGWSAARVTVDAAHEDEGSGVLGGVPLQLTPSTAKVDARQLGEQVEPLISTTQAVTCAMATVDGHIVWMAQRETRHARAVAGT